MIFVVLRLLWSLFARSFSQQQAVTSSPVTGVLVEIVLLLDVSTAPLSIAAFHLARSSRSEGALDQFRPLLIDWCVAPAGTRLTTPSCCLTVVVTPLREESCCHPRRRTLPTHLNFTSTFTSVLPLSVFTMPEVGASIVVSSVSVRRDSRLQKP